MWVPVYLRGAHTGPLCGLFCGPVKSACHQWLNVFFLHFYGAKMFLSCHPSTVPVACWGLREAKVNCAAIFCQLIGHHLSGTEVLIWNFVWGLFATMTSVQTAWRRLCFEMSGGSRLQKWSTVIWKHCTVHCTVHWPLMPLTCGKGEARRSLQSVKFHLSPRCVWSDPVLPCAIFHACRRYLFLPRHPQCSLPYNVLLICLFISFSPRCLHL